MRRTHPFSTLLIVGFVMLVPSIFAETVTTYGDAMRIAKSTKRPVVFFFEEARYPAMELPRELRETTVRCLLSLEEKIIVEDKSMRLVDHPFFSGLKGSPGAVRATFVGNKFQVQAVMPAADYKRRRYEREILRLWTEPVENFLSEPRKRNYLALFPKSTSRFLSDLKQRTDLIFYTKADIPPAYQFDGGVHSSQYNISAVQPSETRGNAAMEFPWEATAGISPWLAYLSRTTPYPPFKAIHFLALPRDGAPILWWYDAQYEGPSSGQNVRWQFPVGTVFGEILLQRYGTAAYLPFEVRTREKMKNGTTLDWASTTFRPFWDPKTLAAAIQRAEPEWKSQPNLIAAVERLTSDYAGELETVDDNSINAQLSDLRHLPHEQVVFRHQGLRYVLPELPAELTRKLLETTPFEPGNGRIWSEKEGLEAFAPTSESESFQLVPTGYLAGHIENSSRSCMQCHNQTLVYARNFGRARDWYGFTPGGDGIFSWHPFAAISYTGKHQPFTFRKALVDSGRLVQARRP